MSQLEARDKGLMGVLLRHSYEVRDASEYFDDIQDVKITKDMLDLARHIESRSPGISNRKGLRIIMRPPLAELLAKNRRGSPSRRRRRQRRATSST